MPQDRSNITLTIRALLRLVGIPFFKTFETIIFLTFSLIIFLSRTLLQLPELASTRIKQATLPGLSQLISLLPKIRLNPPKVLLKDALKIIYSLITTVKKTTTAVGQKRQRYLQILHSFTWPTIRLPRPVLPTIQLPTLSPPSLPPGLIPTASIPIIRFPVRQLSYGLFPLIIILGGIGFYQVILKDLPHPKDLISRRSPLTTKIYSADGQLLYKIYRQENRSLVSLSQIPNHVVQATLAIEDAEFYEHPGFSLKGILRAVQNNLTHQSLQGGSTITQQLIKNTLLTPEKSYVRKIKEVILALLVESYFTKDEILSMYFNEVAYGGTSYGIEAASHMYFNKSVQDLNLAEATLLAGLPAAPTTYSPFGTNPDTAVMRQHEVLRRMVEEGFISQKLADQAKTTPLKFASPATDITAPHFVMYIKDQLVERYGEQLVSQGGLTVTTTLDLDTQRLVEEVIRTQIPQLTPLNIHNAAVIVTEPQTGRVLAMVGSVDYFDSTNDGQVNVIVRPRQPGSSIKPVNYAMALENGLTPATLIVDAPVTYESAGSPPYSPRNYDNRYHGIVTLRTALANSYNIPAVKVLNQFGISRMITTGQALGISTWNNPSRFGLALTLGGGEVTLADMAVVYGTFANSGTRTNLHPISTVADFTGTRQDRFECPLKPSQIAIAPPAHAQTQDTRCPQETQVIKPSTAFLISSILSDNDARTPMFGRHSILDIPPHQVAVKTGTTNNLRDNWTIGYTKDILVGVWVGNNDNTPMSRVASGITGASPIFSQIMSALLQDQPAHNFTPPPGVVQATICPLTGTLTCNACPHPKAEYFTPGTQPQKACNEHLIKQILESKEHQAPPDHP